MMATIGFMQFVSGAEWLMVACAYLQISFRSQSRKMQATRWIAGIFSQPHRRRPGKGHSRPEQFSIDRSVNNPYKSWHFKPFRTNRLLLGCCRSQVELEPADDMPPGADRDAEGSGMDGCDRAQNRERKESPDTMWIERSAVERRSDQDKRSRASRAYFSRGGRERRNTEDRRQSEERRDGWLRLGRWRSISIFDT
jgi:hypothetical protein